MSKYIKVPTFILSFLFASSLFSQVDCKVLMPELDSIYYGSCKKGLAHGKGKAIGADTYEGRFRKGLPNGYGVYKWASGATYKGEWIEGKRDGEGTYTFNLEGGDSVQSGLWEINVYKGEIFDRPRVILTEFVKRYRFRRDGDGDRILIDLMLNGQTNRDILDFTLISTSGSYFELGRSHGIETIVFPVIVKIKYQSWNATHSSRHDATFEFEIFEPGNWQVEISN